MNNLLLPPNVTPPGFKGIVMLLSCWTLSLWCKLKLGIDYSHITTRLSVGDLIGYASGIGSLALTILAGTHYWLKIQDILKKRRAEKQSGAREGDNKKKEGEMKD